ncbi:MAG: class I SAM-dependent methyltransferase [Myxococcales bacterium]|nr:class I SAM-dependent methyltransferase [Myxococcales bacterium]
MRSLSFLVLASLIGCTSSAPPVEPVATAAPSPTEAPPPASASASVPAPAPAAPEAIEIPPAIRAAVDASDRSGDDRALDDGRHPAEMLAFFGVAPGMRVAELGAGGGYTSELLARAVGPTGRVFGQNTKFILEKFAEKPWSERLKKPLMKNVARVDREFDDPLPPDAKDLDAVFVVLFYHDLYWMKVDRAKMNKAVFAALKPGGAYAIVDHAARAGAGDSEVQTLHRIEEKTLRADIEAAGFRLEKEGRFLRNAADTKDWNASPSGAAERRGTTDRFVLLFRKP